MHVERNWLSADTLSSAYIMTTFNPEADVEQHGKVEVRLADCHKTLFLEFAQTGSLKQARLALSRFIHNMQELANKDDYRFDVTLAGNRYHVRKQTRPRISSAAPLWSSITVVQRTKRRIRWGINPYWEVIKCNEHLLRLHADPEMCNEQQWKQKQDEIVRHLVRLHFRLDRYLEGERSEPQGKRYFSTTNTIKYARQASNA